MKSHCIHRGFSWAGSPAAKSGIPQHEYYEALLAYFRTHKRVRIPKYDYIALLSVEQGNFFGESSKTYHSLTIAPALPPACSCSPITWANTFAA